ncbi:hypothetical protein AZI87_00240 [Bdellovibrio bacteriovorus]|uniref:Uncharacterized protein n=1 Tax=Bdellovibrio bacteriovorus TaxID=959 RepID=A0A162GBQ2_BDEBC|nr:hypothetical protein [Bdellovibrio bacteriovorus]KYG67750.1 hypothetical protein AZI87_00240 [Bdellovibrio bacteriovorus]
MSTFVELEIQNLLNEGTDLQQASERLIQNLESSSEGLTLDNVTALAKFLIQAEQPHLLIEFILRYIDNESFPIPWPYFLEALGAVSAELDEKTVKALLEGIAEDNSESEAGRSLALKDLIPELGEWRGNRKYKIHKDYLNNKRQLLDQLITLRTQQLYEQEKHLLQRLQKLYPGDADIRSEVNEHKQRYALEILQRRTPKARTVKPEDFSPKDPEVEKAMSALMQSLHEHAAENPDMAFDFAVAAFMMENYEASLSLLALSEETDSLLWFRLEVLLKCRRFVELLNELSQTEIIFAHEPETFFATAYLRAQALWGLGQKHTAIEVMEGLLASRPHYRAASALLSIWSGQ